MDERDLQNRYERLRSTRTEAGLKHRVAELEAALRGLVATVPMDFDRGDECAYCHGPRHSLATPEVIEHAADCPWLKARALLEEG